MSNPPDLELVDRYIATWNETDAAKRGDLVAKTFAPAARYVDPLVSGDGHAGIAEMIRAVQSQFPGLVFKRSGVPDQYANHLRFSWTLGPASGKPIAGGTDFVVVSDDQRMQSVTGFLDFAPKA